MPNDSSTGGFLTPSSVGGVVNDLAFAKLLQTVIVGITGLPGAMVRPRWQPQPPSIPPLTADWCSVGKERMRGDIDAYREHVGATDISPAFDRVTRLQVMSVFAMFYGPNREQNADLLVMGFSVDENREALKANGFNLVSCSDAELAADLTNEQFVPTSNVKFELRRVLKFIYPVLDIASAQLTLMTDYQGFWSSGYGKMYGGGDAVPDMVIDVVKH